MVLRMSSRLDSRCPCWWGKVKQMARGGGGGGVGVGAGGEFRGFNPHRSADFCFCWTWGINPIMARVRDWAHKYNWHNRPSPPPIKWRSRSTILWGNKTTTPPMKNLWLRACVEVLNLLPSSFSNVQVSAHTEAPAERRWCRVWSKGSVFFPPHPPNCRWMKCEK